MYLTRRYDDHRSILIHVCHIINRGCPNTVHVENYFVDGMSMFHYMVLLGMMMAQ